MSSGLAAVKFLDGTVRWCRYHGTSDILEPMLFEHPDEAWSYRGDRWPDPEGPVESVEIATNYGGGFFWAGKAARNVVTEGIEPHGSEDFMGNEISPRVEMHDGLPGWWRQALNRLEEMSTGT